jgi:hypothetical protein
LRGSGLAIGKSVFGCGAETACAQFQDGATTRLFVHFFGAHKGKQEAAPEVAIWRMDTNAARFDEKTAGGANASSTATGDGTRR